jgi:hypothetical protein
VSNAVAGGTISTDNSSAIMADVANASTDRMRVPLNKDGIMPYATRSRLMQRARVPISYLQQASSSEVFSEPDVEPLHGIGAHLDFSFG